MLWISSSALSKIGGFWHTPPFVRAGGVTKVCARQKSDPVRRIRIPVERIEHLAEVGADFSNRRSDGLTVRLNHHDEIPLLERPAELLGDGVDRRLRSAKSRPAL
jgi:hypothetical protein